MWASRKPAGLAALALALVVMLVRWWPAAGAGELSGTILVSRPEGVVLVQPLSGDTRVMPLQGGAGRGQGVAWSADRQQIAVSVRTRQSGERVGGADLLVLDTAGSEVSSLQRDQPDVALSSPAWLPDDEIVYERMGASGGSESPRIEAAQPDGSARRVLVTNGRLPGPSADGKRLVYVAPGQTFDRLMLLDLVTSDAQPLVENSTEAFVYFSRPRLSPDGRLVAFGASGGPNLNLSADIGGIGAGRRSLFATGLAHGPGWDIWTVGVDGDGLRQVTQFDYEDDLAVAWSPDGEWLAAFGPRALYLIPVRVSGPATPIGRGGLGEPDWIAAGLIGESSPP